MEAEGNPRLESRQRRARTSADRALVPTLRVERSLWKRGLFRIAGVDEAGVGSLSGPVVAGAVLLAPGSRRIPRVRDSKVLPPAERERLFALISRGTLAFAVGAASVAEIERLNIFHATHLAMRRALARLGAYDHALIDGRPVGGLDPARHTSIVHGDASCYAIACASIVAKVTRDRLMRMLAQRYPGYGWDRNAGYSTPHHLFAMRQSGLTPFHRRGYLPVRLLLEQQSPC